MSGRRNLKVVTLVLLAGAMVGTLFGDLVGFALPEGVVKQFFLQSTERHRSDSRSEDQAQFCDHFWSRSLILFFEVFSVVNVGG